MPKRRSDSKIAALPAHIRAALDAWLVEENISYEKAVERLNLDFNVETSVGALCRYYTTDLFELRHKRAAAAADHVAEVLAGDPGRFEAVTIDLIKSKIFARAVAEEGDINELKILAGILGDSEKLRLKREEVGLQSRRLTILEEKHVVVKKQLEVAIGKARSKGGLTAETLKQIEEAAAIL